MDVRSRGWRIVSTAVGVRDKAVQPETQSFKELLVLKGKKFLFFRLLDIGSPMTPKRPRRR